MSAAPDTEKTLLFLHIQKTAGTTLLNIITRQYEKRRTLNLYDPRTAEKITASLSEEERKNIRLVNGHFSFGLHRYFPGKCDYITILRDPLERTVSQFHFILDFKTHPLHEEYNRNGYTLLHVIRNRMMIHLDNYMVRVISGKDDVPFGECTEEMLDTALENLEKYFTLTGLQENFDAFVLSLADLYHWKKFLYYRRQRTGVSRPRVQDLDAETLEAVRSCNVLDQKLYDIIAPKVREELRKKGPAFEARVEKFKRKNQLMNRYLGWWPRALTP
ncbi:MAG TPA: sulfotransferase family 2 domain-containing protein [Bacteroidia bacterium]|nr:sulfotransferase family 2 domain-containing protein [Bacteroidia bacterium]